MAFKSKSIIFFFSLLYLTLYIPLSFTIYSSSWYEFNYNDYNIDEQVASEVSENLINYLLYKDNLDSSIWSEKEIRHFNDVRDIYLILHLIAIISLIFTLLYGTRKRIKDSSILSIELIIILLVLFLLTDFTYFWNNVFHQLLFSNMDWIYTSSDVSYYLFPQEFFISSILFVGVVSIIFNIILLLISKKREKN